MDMDKAKIRYDRSVTRLLDQIQRILRRDNKSIADLSREIGRSYHQTYSWMVIRKYHPSGKGLMILQAWRDKQISPAGKASALAGVS